MATLKVKMKDGFFVGSNNVKLEHLEPTHVIGNGWDCIITENGTVECKSIKNHMDGEHSIRYMILSNGYTKLTKKLPGQKPQVLRKGFVLPRGEKITFGTIILTGGEIKERYAYFRIAN